MQLAFSWTSLKICLLPICMEQNFLQLYRAAYVRGPNLWLSFAYVQYICQPTSAKELVEIMSVLKCTAQMFNNILLNQKQIYKNK